MFIFVEHLEIKVVVEGALYSICWNPSNDGGMDSLDEMATRLSDVEFITHYFLNSTVKN